MIARIRRRARGVTLIELMVVLGLIAILSSIAVGMSGNIVRRQRFREVVREGLDALILARNSALSKGGHTAVVFQTNRIVAFRDVNGDGRYGTGDELLKEFPRTNSNPYPTDVVRSCVSGLFEMGSSLARRCINNSGTTYIPTVVFHSDGFCWDDFVNTADPTEVSGTIAFTETVLGTTLTLDIQAGGAVQIR